MWQWFFDVHGLRHGDTFNGYVITWGDLRAPKQKGRKACGKS